MTVMSRVMLIGAGGHAQVVADILRAMQSAGENVEVIGYLDDNPALQGHRLQGYKVLGSLVALSHFTHDAVIVAIGDNRIRASLQERLSAQGERFFTAIHPQSIIANDVSIGEGTMVCAGVVVNVGTQIGKGVILNTGCTVDHHNRIGNFVHIAPGVNLAGNITVGEEAMVGVGAVAVPGINIGARAVVGAGAVVIRNVPENMTAIGVPANHLQTKE